MFLSIFAALLQLASVQLACADGQDDLPFPILDVDAKVEVFLSGKAFQSSCTQTKTSNGQIAQYPSFKMIFHFDGEQKQVLHRYVRLYGNIDCSGTCQSPGNRCNPFDFVVSYGSGPERRPGVYNFLFSENGFLSPDLLVINESQQTFMLGDVSTRDDRGFPEKGDINRSYFLLPPGEPPRGF